MRIFLILIDGFGVGELPDAKLFGDSGSNTFVNIYKNYRPILPNMISMGLMNIDGLNLPKITAVNGAYGKMAEKTLAKDTTAGHWEIAGIPIHKPFVTFPNGIPYILVKKLEAAFGIRTLCNNIASGTEVINRLGDSHIKTYRPIVYTSADSVLQIACHEKIYSNEKLYSMCEIAREICRGEFEVGRVIARPFAGESGNYFRTAGRKDFSVQPNKDSMLDKIKAKGMQMIGIGKIEDIFPKRSLTESYHTKSNSEAITQILELMDKGFEKGLLFANLVDTDMNYGHRNDALGFSECLEQIDRGIGLIKKEMRPDDVIIITADHGNDPTTSSTDHSREYVPVLFLGNLIQSGVNIGIQPTFECLGATILEMLNIEHNILSFWGVIRKK